jgi:hypothetical protein
MRFGLVNGFIGHLQIVTISNYCTITNSHTLQFTTSCTKSPQSAVFTSGCSLLLGSCPHTLAAISHQPPTALIAVSSLWQLVLVKQPQHRSHGKYRFQQLHHYCVLHSHYLTAAVSLALAFLPRGSVFMVITPQLLPLLPP